MLRIVDTLEDSHVLNLSQRITSEHQLRDLGSRALGVRQHIIGTALFNDRTCIQDAAYNVLSTWLKGQPSRQEAFMSMQTGLKRARMNQLAADLRMWVQGIEDASRITDERRLLKLLFPTEHSRSCLE